MCDGSRGRARGRSGGRTRVTVEPQLVEPAVRVSRVSVQDMAETHHVGTLTNTFHGENFSQEEQRIALEANALFEVALNVRTVNYVTVVRPRRAGAAAAAGEFMLFNVVPNTNTGTLDIFKIGTPPTALPSDNDVATVTRRLNSYGIAFDNAWRDQDKRVALMALNILTDQELERVRGLHFRRRGTAPPEVHQNESEQEGGAYWDSQHTVDIYNLGMVNGALMSLGTNSTNLLPGCAQTVLHEVGHALAFAEVRLAGERNREARANLLRERERISNRWPDYFRVRNPDPDHYEYQYEQPSTVPTSDRPAYSSDLQSLRSAENAFSTANRSYTGMDQSHMAADFQRIQRQLAPVTPYSRTRRANMGRDAERVRAASEEFLADSFAIYRWNPEWLRANRRTVFDFFDQNRHLR